MEFEEFARSIADEYGHINDGGTIKHIVLCRLIETNNFDLFVEMFNYGYLDYRNPNFLTTQCIILCLRHERYEMLIYLIGLGVNLFMKDDKDWWYEERFIIEYNKLKEKHFKLKML